MGRHDDETILPNWTLARGVHADWIDVDEGGREVVQSRAFDDSNQEVSCFILEEVGGVEGFQRNILPVIQRELGRDLRLATVEVRIVRSSGRWIYRKPEEFSGNSAHVVQCPAQHENISRSQFKKEAREIARLAVLHPSI